MRTTVQYRDDLYLAFLLLMSLKSMTGVTYECSSAAQCSSGPFDKGRVTP